MACLAPEVRLSKSALRTVWVAVFMSHAVVGFLLYGWRALSRFSESSLAGSDWIVFGVPFLVCLCCLLRRLHLFAVSEAAISLPIRWTRGFVSSRSLFLLLVLHAFRGEHLWDLARLSI